MTSSAALEKLARFQLRDPNRYVLAAVAAGCAAGAEEIAVTIRPDSCKIELVGWLGLKLETLRGLFTSLFSSDPALTPLRYLARAVLGAAGLDPYYISLHLTDPKGQNVGSLRLTGTRFASLNAWGRGRPGLCLYVQEHANAGVFQRVVGSFLGAQSPTLEMLRASCGFSTVPIRVNGKLIGCLPRLGQCTRVWKLGDVEGHWSGSPRVQQSPVRGNWRALIGRSPNQAWGTAEAVVVHGVQYPVSSEIFGPKYSRGIIWCDDLRLDLSLENVVEDERWRALLNSLRRQCEPV